MTVCVAVKVRDCIVFAADSAVTISIVQEDGKRYMRNIWNHGIKVYNLHKSRPIVAMSAGDGNLGDASVSELVKYFRAEFTGMSEQSSLGYHPDDYTMEQLTGLVAKILCEFSTEKSSLDFFIGGYGSVSEFGEIWKFTIREGQLNDPVKVVDEKDFDSVLWGGYGGIALQRLIYGYDEQLPKMLADANVDSDIIKKVKGFYTPLVSASMPVQDAIDLADYLVSVAKGHCAFSPTLNIVGGDTDIAVVTRHEGFKWVKRKHFYDAKLN